MSNSVHGNYQLCFIIITLLCSIFLSLYKLLLIILLINIFFWFELSNCINDYSFCKSLII